MLRDEIDRDAHEGHRRHHDGPSAAEAEAEAKRLEKLATEIVEAREALRKETARLEALVAKNETAAAEVAQAKKDTAAAQAAAAMAPDAGDPSVKKPPTSLDGLAKAMRGMKPEQAAPIISRLDRKMGADVLQRMPAADAGKVMAQCKPEVAAELAVEIASRTPRSELKR
jgi:flagellar motility protein MotE (MotC chaperone)